VRPGDRVRRGERMGLIMFGSRVDLWLPPDVRPLVRAGERVRAGATAVAEVQA
jgi:phosphatidylserine decarboxylase